jgi:hypothetical protein
MTKRKIEYWVIPPEADAEFVAGMQFKQNLDNLTACADRRSVLH